MALQLRHARQPAAAGAGAGHDRLVVSHFGSHQPSPLYGALLVLARWCPCTVGIFICSPLTPARLPACQPASLPARTPACASTLPPAVLSIQQSLLNSFSWFSNVAPPAMQGRARAGGLRERCKLQETDDVDSAQEVRWPPDLHLATSRWLGGGGSCSETWLLATRVLAIPRQCARSAYQAAAAATA